MLAFAFINQVKLYTYYVCQRVAELFLVYCLFCFTTVKNGVKVAEVDKSTLFLRKKKNPPPILILDSDVPSRAETRVFAAVRVIRCGCGGQLPTPVFCES